MVRVAVAIAAVTLALGATAHAAGLLIRLSTFGSQGSGAGQFQTPVGVAVAPTSGAVYVADSGNARVQKFDAKGNFVSAWGWGVTDGMASSEVCIANCQAGIPGSGAGQFSNPTSIAATQNRVYVGDAGNNVVLVFDPNGGFIATIDGTTTPQGHFVTVAGVAVDQSGNLWVADGSTNLISEFDSKRKFLQQWQDPFGQTIAIAVDATNNAVYLIRGAQTTERFTLTGGNETVIDNGSGIALGLNLQTGDLYVDHGGDVAIYDAAATSVGSLSLAPTTNSQGIAFAALKGGSTKPGQGNVYVTDAGNHDVAIYGTPPPGPPLITAESAVGTGLTTATLNATIVPAGFDTTCTFQFVSSTDFAASGYTNATTVPCTPADLGSSFTFQQASADISGLTFGAFYHFQAVATNSAGTTTGADMVFQAGPGDWTPVFRCPVDDPLMLATDGGVTTIALCVASNSTHGTITIGTTTTPTGNSNLQVGVILDENTGNTTVVGSPTGALVADPATVTAGGVTVTATVESAGLPTNFNFIAGIELGVPIITIPVKIHLVGQNIDLGPSCFIGSEVDPILLIPANTDLTNASFKAENFDANGVPDPNGLFATIVISGAVQGDNMFAVPGATGCGPNGDGSLDAAVNAVVGLPAPAGTNNLVLDDATSSIVALPGQNGQQFADAWHAIFGAGPSTTTTTSSTSSTSSTTTSTSTTTPTTSSTTTSTTTTVPTTTSTTTSTTTTVPTTTSSTTSTTHTTTTSTTSSTTSSTVPTTTTSTTSSTTSSTVPTTTTSTTSSTTSSTVPTTTTSTTSSTTTTTLQLTRLAFTNTPGTTNCGGAGLATPPAAPFSGEIDSDLACTAKVSDLGLGCLYIGGGGATGIPPGATPDGATTMFDISGTNLVASNGTSNRDCSKGAGPGRHCIGGTNTGAVCATDTECGGTTGSCALDANCFFAAPLPIANAGLSTCVVNVIQSDAGGTGDITTGTSSVSIPLSSRVYLTANSASPCPKCVSGTCNYGPGTTCSAGSNTLGTSQDCPPPPSVFLAPLAVGLNPLTTGASSMTGASGNFCPSPPNPAAQRNNGAFGKTAAQCIKQTGAPAGNLTDGNPHPSSLAAVFCIPASGNPAIDPAADIPGPGAFSITGNAQALP